MFLSTDELLIFYYAAANIIAFAAFGADKIFAEKRLWRFPEAMLIFFAVMGGGTGALFAMLLFHHKTKKTKFLVMVPLSILAHIGVWIYLSGKF